MRKLPISLALALLLLLVQQGAVVHAVSHICRVGTNVQPQVHADTVLEKTCQLCLAYSQAGNPVLNTAAGELFEPSGCLAQSQVSCAAIAAEVLTPRSRGPPSSALKS